jgi:hypothetical protein
LSDPTPKTSPDPISLAQRRARAEATERRQRERADGLGHVRRAEIAAETPALALPAESPRLRMVRSPCNAFPAPGPMSWAEPRIRYGPE